MQIDIPKWDAKKPHVPIDKYGNWMHYPDHNVRGLAEVQPFEANLKVSGMYAGRTAKGFTLENLTTGVKYTMFMDDLLTYLKIGSIIAGVLHGTWTVSKRGQNYGIKHV